jgi:hypothetical protein
MRHLLRLCGLWLLAFVGMVAAALAQPSNPEPYTALFLTEPGCAAPCFLGIRLNHTPAEEAYSRLENHPWTSNVNMNTQRGVIRWNWAASSPRYLNSFRENEIRLQHETFNVSAITLRIDAPAGELWSFLIVTADADGYMLDRHIRVDTPPCLTDPLHFWSSPSQRVYYTTRGTHYPTLYQPKRAYTGVFRCAD